MAYLSPDQIPPGTSPATRAAIIDMIRASQQIVPVAGETERNQVLAAWEEATGAPVSEMNPCWVTRADTGALERNRGNGWQLVGGRGVAYGFAAGVATVVGDGSRTASVDVALPVGMFTQTPVVIPTSTNSNYYAFWNRAQSNLSSVRIGVAITTSSSFTASLNVAWVALQLAT